MTEVPYDWARLATVKHMHRSVSQAQKYLTDLGGCNYRYFLSYVVKAWDRPAAWLPQGLAVHEAAEWWEKGGRRGSLEEMQEQYRQSYREHTKRLLEGTPNAREWFSSGRYEGPEDITRRAELGLEQVAKYFNYYVNQKPGEVVWLTPDGTPAIELEFNVRFGSVWVKGYIDQIISEMVEGHSVEPPDIFQVMRDIKTGVQPGGIFQLATYRFAVLKEYGVDFVKGDFWMGRNGKPTNPLDLTSMSDSQVTEYYERLDAGIKAEEFDPSPSFKNCERCGVRTACQFAM